MKKFGIIAVMVCAAALCFALAGCGSSATTSSSAASSDSSSTSAASTSAASESASSASAASTQASSASAAASTASASATAASADSKFIGDWQMLDGTVDGTTYSASDLATANNMGMGVVLSIKADGTFALEGGGGAVNVKGTWTEEGEAATMTDSDGKAYVCSIDGTGILTMELNGEETHYSKK